MPWNGSGTFGRQYGSSGWVNDRNAGTKILATRHDTNDDDLADGVNNCLTKDGQNAATANLPMGGFKHTSVASATARDQYASAGQIADGGLVYLTSVSGSDTITASATPAITAYAAGQAFRFISAGANTGAVTLAINGLTAQAVTKNGASALIAGDISSGAVVEVVYDGTRFQMVSSIPSARRTLAVVPVTSGTTVNLVTSGLTGQGWTEIVVTLDAVSLNGTNDVLLQIGDDTGFVATGYNSRCSTLVNAAAVVVNTSSTGFIINAGVAAGGLYGSIILTRQNSNIIPGGDTWHITGSLNLTSTGGVVVPSGNVLLTSGTPVKTLDRIRLISSAGNTFDNVSANAYVYGRL